MHIVGRILRHVRYSVGHVESAALTIRNIAKSFGTYSVLQGIDMALVPGDVTVLMRAVGAGKPTLVKMISGVYRADRTINSHRY